MSAQVTTFFESPVRLGAVVFVGITIFYKVLSTSLKKYPYPLPPSPPGEPLIGHVRKLPTENAHLTHLEYAKEYGMYHGLWMIVFYMLKRFNRFGYRLL